MRTSRRSLGLPARADLPLSRPQDASASLAGAFAQAGRSALRTV